MNAKNIFRNMRGLAMSALLLIPAAFVSCSDDDTEGGSPYFRLENTVVSSKLVTASSDLGFDAEAIIGDATLELIRYDIRSNCNWSVECNSTDGDWIKFYPKTGQGDGKVRFCLEDNDANTPRSATVVFRYADGRQTETTLVVNQSANEPDRSGTLCRPLRHQGRVERDAVLRTRKSRMGNLHRDGQRDFHARHRGVSRAAGIPEP